MFHLLGAVRGRLGVPGVARGKESQHKRIPLFAAFGLGHRVGLSIAIMPNIIGSFRVEHAEKGKAGICSGRCV